MYSRLYVSGFQQTWHHRASRPLKYLWRHRGRNASFPVACSDCIVCRIICSKTSLSKREHGCGHAGGWEGRVQMWALFTSLCRDGVIRNHSISQISPQNSCILICFFICFFFFVVLKSSATEAECVVSSFLSSFVPSFWHSLMKKAALLEVLPLFFTLVLRPLRKPTTLWAAELQVPFWWHLTSLGFSCCQTPNECMKWVKHFCYELCWYIRG